MLYEFAYRPRIDVRGFFAVFPKAGIVCFTPKNLSMYFYSNKIKK